MEPGQLKDRAKAFLNAHFAGDAKAAMALCAPSFESTIYAPTELFTHFGQKRGLSWIEESILLQQQRYAERHAEIVSALGDGDEAALVVRIRLTKRTDKRVIAFLSVHLFSFENGLIVTHREMFDSFDLVEQLLGTDITAEFAERLGKAV